MNVENVHSGISLLSAHCALNVHCTLIMSTTVIVFYHAEGTGQTDLSKNWEHSGLPDCSNQLTI